MSEYKRKFSFDDRKQQTNAIKEKYEDKCPIYLSYDKLVKVDLDSSLKHFNKYIVTSSLTLAQFLVIVRKKIKFNSQESLTLFIEIYEKDKLQTSILAPTTVSLEELYLKNKDEDGFLYLKLVKENVFG
jgi:hypothetical protein